jgi:ADP-heptose:LPS heptosyltransferase
VDGVLIDKRLPRWNILYLLRLKKRIKKFNFLKVYDLQNSSRTSFYKKYLFGVSNWSSTETTLKKGTKKKDFDGEAVLDRFKFQLENSGVVVKNSLRPEISWTCINVEKIVNKYSGKKLILILPFSSAHLPHKRWPYYNQLIDIVKSKHPNLEIIVAPGPEELETAKQFRATSITNNNRALSIMELAGLIKKSSFVIANDTGPTHIAAHLGKKGIVLFGYHTTATKVSITTDNLKALTVDNLNNLSAEKVYSTIQHELGLITD